MLADVPRWTAKGKKATRARITTIINKYLLTNAKIDRAGVVEDGAWLAHSDGRRVVHDRLDGGCSLCGCEIPASGGRGRVPVFDAPACRDAVQALDEIERILRVLPFGSAEAVAEVRGTLRGAMNSATVQG